MIKEVKNSAKSIFSRTSRTWNRLLTSGLGLAGVLTRPGEIRIIAWAMIGMAVLLQSASVIWDAPFLHRELGGDFIAFYTAGKTLNEFPVRTLYNPDFQQDLRFKIIPDADRTTGLPYLYPPFVAAALSPLARLPYRWAFVSWLVIGGALYAAGLYLIQSRSGLGVHRDTALLLAVSFSPFLYETWGGGQISAIAFSALAGTLWLERAGKPFAAGLCAGLCCYKLPIFSILAAMFLLARLWRLLAGALVTSAALAALSFLMLGFEGVAEYRHLGNLYWTGLFKNPSAWPLHKFADLNAFFHLLLGGDTLPGRILLVLSACAALLWAARTWIRYRVLTEEERALCWAGTMPLMLLANLYAPVYDMTLIVLSGFLVAGVVYRSGRADLARYFEAMVLLVYLGSIVGQPIARTLHIQVLTIVLILCAVFIFSLEQSAGLLCGHRQLWR